MVSRPLDALDKARGKRVIIRMKNGAEVTGILGAYDVHLNIWVTDAEITQEETKTKIGNVLIRGDTLVWVSPAQ